jgi:SAM-dependent methyltransferase
MLDTEIENIFIVRDHCVACGSIKSSSRSSGQFGEEPLRSFIENDPWGENPMPVLEREEWDFRECSDCGQRWHARILSPRWNDTRFSKWMSEDAIREFERDHGNNHDAARAVQHVLRLKDFGVRRILDFGCGFGRFLEMCRLFGLDAHGVDRSHARRSGAGVQVHAELDDVPGSFDAITMFEVLEHLDDPMDMLRQLKSRLNPGGVMVVEVPDTSGVSDFYDRESYYKIHPLDHINAFTPDTLVNFMRRAGCRPLDKEPAFVTTSLMRVAKDVAKARLKQRSTQRYFALV